MPEKDGQGAKDSALYKQSCQRGTGHTLWLSIIVIALSGRHREHASLTWQVSHYACCQCATSSLSALNAASVANLSTITVSKNPKTDLGRTIQTQLPG